MRLLNSGSIVQAIEQRGGLRVREAHCVPLPVPGSFGVRATLSLDPPRHLDFIIDDVPLHDVAAADLKEADFSAWPPREHA